MSATSNCSQAAEAAGDANPAEKNTLPTGFLDFRRLLDFVPLGERTLRDLIKRGIIPHIRVKGGRRLLFHTESVERALVRFQRGGIE
jgi:hypothetical protein